MLLRFQRIGFCLQIDVFNTACRKGESYGSGDGHACSNHQCSGEVARAITEHAYLVA